MRVFRITLAEYSDRLFASGRPARWNSKGVFVIYAASSRSLACLENVVHRSGEGLNHLFRVMIIDVPDDLAVYEILEENLPMNWKAFENQSETRKLGDDWFRSGDSAVMKVPSVIIPEESNYLLNPAHPDFANIKLIQTTNFLFDPRLT